MIHADRYRTLSVRNVGTVLLLCAISGFLSACSIFPWWANANTKLPQLDTINNTSASLHLGDDATRDGRFVGVAISGGGSRAANFGAAVLLELQERGILDKVDIVSSVSGGSIAAAYYALDGYPDKSHPKIVFTRRRIDELFARDFQWRWIWRWFDPWNIWRYWLTAFDRSDIMAQVFEANLFHGATFAHLPARPKVMINASNFVNGRKFVFSNEAFDLRGADLASYPVARSVMASGAFPGVFANVTLQDYTSAQQRKRHQYVHLFDGGPIDNLGVGTLIKTLQAHVMPNWGTPDPMKASGFPGGCLIISIDAYTKRVERAGGKGYKRADLADTRPWYGFLVDTNAIEATDDLLAVKRNEILHEMGLDREDTDIFGSFPLFRLNLDDDDETGTPTSDLLKRISYGPALPDRQTRQAAMERGTFCHVWHIGLAQMPTCDACSLGRRVNGIGTWYRIDEKKAQCGLFEAARALVQTMWANQDLQYAVLNGVPTTEPAPQIPPMVEDELGQLSQGEPEIIEQDGVEVCRITASSDPLHSK